MSETDTDVVETMQVLQYARLLMPSSVSGNTSSAELLRPYKNRAQCLEDFSDWWLAKDKGSTADERAAAQAKYDFVIQMAPVAWREYNYWESHSGWNNKYIWEQTQKGGRVVRQPFCCIREAEGSGSARTRLVLHVEPKGQFGPDRQGVRPKIV